MSEPIDQKRFKKAIRKLFDTVRELEEMFPGRKFTPDGLLVGSIGECVVASEYGLELMPHSNPGFDAIDKSDRKIEIKATFADRVGFRSEPEYCVVVKLEKEGTFEEIYTGPGRIVWTFFTNKKLPSNGQRPISISRLRKLQELVPDKDRIPRV